MVRMASTVSQVSVVGLDSVVTNVHVACSAPSCALHRRLQVARLARKLPVGNLDAMAAELGGAPVPLAAGLDEDDLT